MDIYKDNVPYLLTDEDKALIMGKFPQLKENKPVVLEYDKRMLREVTGEDNKGREIKKFIYPRYLMRLEYGVTDPDSKMFVNWKFSKKTPTVLPNGKYEVVPGREGIRNGTRIFDPIKDFNLLWFLYSFCPAIQGGKNESKVESKKVLKFYTPIADAEVNVSNDLAIASAKVKISDMSKTTLKALYKKVNGVAPAETLTDGLIIQSLYKALDNPQFRPMILEECNDGSMELRRMVKEAIDERVLDSSMDGKSVEFEGQKLVDCSIEEVTKIVNWLAKNPKKADAVKAALTLEKEKTPA